MVKIYSRLTRLLISVIFFASLSVTAFSVFASTIFSEIPVGKGPVGIVMTPDKTQTYVTNVFDNSISIINTIQRSVTHTLFFDTHDTDYFFSFLGQIAVSPDSSTLYSSVEKKSPLDGIAIRIVNIPSETHTDVALNDRSAIDGLVLSPDGLKLYVVSFGKSLQKPYLHCIDTKTKNVIEKPLICPGLPEIFRGGRATLSPDAKTLYVLCNYQPPSGSKPWGQLLAIDANSLQVKSYTDLQEEYVFGLALSPDGSTVYTAGSKTIFIINTVSMQIIGSMNPDSPTFDLALSTDGNQLFASERDKNQFEIFDIQSRLSRGTVSIDSRKPSNLAVTLDNKALYGVITDNNSVVVIDLGQAHYKTPIKN